MTTTIKNEIPFERRDFSVNDVARMRSVSSRQIWREVAEGKIKVRRYSKRIIRIAGTEILRTQAEAEGAQS
jgi:hypothetical protein